MIWRLLLPMVVALTAGGGTRVIQERLRPRLGAFVLTAICLFCALSVLWATAALAFGYLVELPALAERVGWCRELLGTHDRVPPPLGIAALLALPLMLCRAVRAHRRHRAFLGGSVPVGGVEVLACDEPIAYAVPGRPGHIVVSVGMLAELDHDERAVLFAHEQAHLDHRHDRFVGVASAAAAAVPVLQPLLRQVRYATERWADEVAARRLGDRRLVARAIARAALASHDAASPAFALAGLGVPDRVRALLDDPCRRRRSTAAALPLGLAALVASFAGSTVQLHHLVSYALHICSG